MTEPWDMKGGASSRKCPVWRHTETLCYTQYCFLLMGQLKGPSCHMDIWGKHLLSAHLNPGGPSSKQSYGPASSTARDTCSHTALSEQRMAMVWIYSSTPAHSGQKGWGIYTHSWGSEFCSSLSSPPCLQDMWAERQGQTQMNTAVDSKHLYVSSRIIIST